jgi:hypothetical protein
MRAKTIAEICSKGVALATAIITRTGSFEARNDNAERKNKEPRARRGS